MEREPGAVTGSMYVVSVLTFPLAAILFVALWLFTGWPPWLQAAVGAPVLVAFSLWALPASRALWAAVEYATDLRTGEARRPDYGRRSYARAPVARAAECRRGEAEEQSR